MLAIRLAAAIVARRAGGDRCSCADSRVRATRVGADHNSFAEVFNTRKASGLAIRVEIDRGFPEDAATNLMRIRVEFDFFPGWQRNKVSGTTIDDGRQIHAREKKHETVHDFA